MHVFYGHAGSLVIYITSKWVLLPVALLALLLIIAVSVLSRGKVISILKQKLVAVAEGFLAGQHPAESLLTEPAPFKEGEVFPAKPEVVPLKLATAVRATEPPYTLIEKKQVAPVPEIEHPVDNYSIMKQVEEALQKIAIHHPIIHENLNTPEEPMSAAPIALPKESKLQDFESFLKKAGKVAGVILADVVKYALPIASIVSIADPAVAPEVAVFSNAVALVQKTVVLIQQRWAAQGSEADAQKLADVLSIVEQPIIAEFAAVGIKVDTAYVTNLVNGVVAILNSQPGSVLPAQG